MGGGGRGWEGGNGRRKGKGEGRGEERGEMRQEVKDRQLQAPNQCSNTITVLRV